MRAFYLDIGLIRVVEMAVCGQITVEIGQVYGTYLSFFRYPLKFRYLA
jgi:hypothetical protein